MTDKKEIVSASPKVRKLAREFGADIYKIQGSQREGRVSEEDVKSYIKDSIFGKVEEKVSSPSTMMELRSDVSYVRSNWLETEVVRWNGELEYPVGDPLWVGLIEGRFEIQSTVVSTGIAATNVRSASAPAVHGVSSQFPYCVTRDFWKTQVSSFVLSTEKS